MAVLKTNTDEVLSILLKSLTLPSYIKEVKVNECNLNICIKLNKLMPEFWLSSKIGVIDKKFALYFDNRFKFLLSFVSQRKDFLTSIKGIQLANECLFIDINLIIKEKFDNINITNLNMDQKGNIEAEFFML